MRKTKKTAIQPLTLTDTPLSFRFNMLTKKYYGAVTKHFEDLNLERNFFVLNIISKHEHVTQQSLANCLNIDKARVVHVIDYLSGKGLVKREASPEDRREHRIVPTKKGFDYVKRISKGFTELNKTAFKGFSREEKENFYTMMERIHRNLSELPSENYSLKFIKSKK